MKEIHGLINRTINFSSIDGPGNRLVIFFQGCNFRCINCHNPQTMGNCVGFLQCGICIENCKNEALQNTGFSKEKCMGCDTCESVCPFNSDPRARFMTPEEVLQEFILPASPFISGVTLSGGEATLHKEFIIKLRKLMNNDTSLRDLTLFLDSNGSVSIWDEITPYIDGVMLDFKAFSSIKHKEITGVRNETVLASIYNLYNKNKLWEIRILILPGYNDDNFEINSIKMFLGDNAPKCRIRLIPFRKYGVREPYNKVVEPDTKKVEQIKDLFRDAGFCVYVT
ncbi:YjjW family glycine radical enzyme activase [Natranaerobius trueperi]|uniref:Glycine radical enzyme activase n=1 Tax=Natranaerobius trueperi TaxID=759412 RepID=A0A226C188_9FIRM|nr:YjjW family glycine radical enzyme activase [Natranaerobius trueperi]OWZ84782.1 glycine radical enzyme activase [Natranaerobius trueperi]